MNLEFKSTVLFQGDSITDAGRKHNVHEALGEGYSMLTTAWLSASHPEKRLRFINRGLAGNRVRDLRNRWNKDCLDLKPSLVSIMVGINDAFGKPFWREPTSTESFRSDYEFILEQTRINLKSDIVLVEPFLLSNSENYEKTKITLMPILEIVRELSSQFRTILIPLNEIFAKAECLADAPYWSLDGVHPTLAGHALIALSWIRGVNYKTGL